jgi:hypothetical protein
VDDPVVDPEGLLPDDDGPTELVSMREPTPPVQKETEPADVSWLLAEVRAQYGRGGDL